MLGADQLRIFYLLLIANAKRTCATGAPRRRSASGVAGNTERRSQEQRIEVPVLVYRRRAADPWRPDVLAVALGRTEVFFWLAGRFGGSAVGGRPRRGGLILGAVS
jgi:hypothetical protein